MASVSELLLLIKGDAAPALKALKEVGAGIKETQAKAEESKGSFAGMLGKTAAIGGGAAAIGLVTVAVGSGVEAYTAYNQVHTQLINTMKNMNQTLDPAKLEETNAAMRKLGVSDTETEQSIQKLVQAGMSANDAMEAQHALNNRAVSDNTTLSASTDEFIAAAHGKGKALTNIGIILPTTAAGSKAVASADAAAAKAQEAYTQAVRDHGPYSKQAEAAQQKLNDAIAKQKAAHDSQARGMGGANALLEQYSKFSNAADEKSGTFAGTLQQLKVQWDHVAVAIGEKVAPYLQKIAQWVTDHMPQIQDFIENALKVMASVFGTIGSVLGATVLPALGFLADHIDAVKVVAALLLGVWLGMKAIGLVGMLMEFGGAFLAMAGEEGIAAAAASALGIAAGVDAVVGFAAMAAGAIASATATAAAFLLPLAPFILIAAAVAGLVYLIVTDFNEIKAVVMAVVGAIVGWVKEHWMLLVAIFTGPIGLVVALIATHLNQIKDTFTAVFNHIKDFVGGVINNVVGAFRGMGDGIGSVFEGVKRTVGAIWDGIAAVIKAPINLVISGLDALISLINAIQIHVHGPDWLGSPGFDWDGMKLGSIPLLAKGATLSSATLAILGEKGKEHAVPDLAMTELLGRAAEAGASANGGNHTINVINPKSDFDAAKMVDTQQWLARMGNRGGAAPLPPMAGAA